MVHALLKGGGGADKELCLSTLLQVVDKDRDVLVKFDKEYPWGDEHDAYKKLAETVGQADTPLIIAGVPISNSDTYPVNPKLAVRGGLKTLQLLACVHDASRQAAACW